MTNKQYFAQAWEYIADDVISQALDVSQMFDREGRSHTEIFNDLCDTIARRLRRLGKEMDES